ncbi:MAG: hypothetical protein K2J89_02175 [Clostridia bacterium]|nr:hypothetical protein [Clostridia bacterium]
MKRLSIKDSVVKPIIIGSVVTILGIALLVYYRYLAESKIAASYVVSALTVAAGVLIAVSSIFRLVKIKADLQIETLGKQTTAKFLSYNTEKTSGKVAVYYIEYQYEDEGKTYVCKSPSQFNWYEVLTLKVVGEFPIKTYKGKSVLDCDLMKLHLENREAVAELNRKYEQALEELSIEKNKK